MEPTTARHLQLILDEFEGRAFAVARAVSPRGAIGDALVHLNPIQVDAAVHHLTTTLNYIKALR